MQILATDFGPHPHDKWALATARMLVPLEGVKDADRQIAAMRLQIAVADALSPHHEGVQTVERDGLEANGDDHFADEFDPANHVPAAIAAVVKASKSTLWEAHFADPEVQKIVGDVIGSHFLTASNIEREWHGRRNPDSVAAAAFIERHHPAAA